MESTQIIGFSISWAILEDLNDMLRANEKNGKNSHPNWLPNGFRASMFECRVSDLPLEGFPFTCEMGRGTESGFKRS